MKSRLELTAEGIQLIVDSMVRTFLKTPPAIQIFDRVRGSLDYNYVCAMLEEGINAHIVGQDLYAVISNAPHGLEIVIRKRSSHEHA